jgi:tRNA-guanine family transglycosylase
MLYRTRELQTPSGKLNTPTLFPVRNVGKRSSDNTPEYHKAIPDLNTAMINSHSIYTNESIKSDIESKTIHQVMDFEGVVFADSGGFDFRDKDELPDPEKILETQQNLDADIYATLDLPPLPDMRSSKKRRRINKSIKFAERASDAKEDDALLYATIHGHDARTIRNSIQYLEKNGEFDGFALGGLVPFRSDYSKVIDLVLAARQSTDKPLHVFGLGGLLYQLLLMYLGVDSFDSSAFIRCGSHRRYFVPGFGDHTMSEFDSIEHLPCSCPVCSEHTFSEVKASRDLITKHNLWAMVLEVRKFRWMVEAGEDVENYLDLRFEGNEVTKRAYQTAKQKIRRLN